VGEYHRRIKCTVSRGYDQIDNVVLSSSKADVLNDIEKRQKRQKLRSIVVSRIINMDYKVTSGDKYS